MKQWGFIFIFLLYAFATLAQPANCVFKPPQYTIHFGKGNVKDLNTAGLSYYQRISGYCPSDGHYAYVPYTSNCFGDDWHTLPEDHTPGDNNGNMLVVNAGPRGGVFLSTSFGGLKPNTTYELGIWVINLCRPTKKCPFLLLPSLNIRLETPEGGFVADIVTRDLPRVEEPIWVQHRVYFTTPGSISTVRMLMTNNAPSGCGNDFALDDITIRECVRQNPPPAVPSIKPGNKKPAASKQPVKKVAAPSQKKVNPVEVTKPKTDVTSKKISAAKPSLKVFPPPPLVLKTRENTLVRRIETEAGEINIKLYDNAEIDGDTVSIYHNNTLVKSHVRLSQKPISINIGINASQPHHELVMVAENLGSIPPNTSVMIITTGTNRYEVFISSSEQRNAKVVFDLKSD